MGGHMAQVASEVFNAPAVVFNPAPRVQAAAKLALTWLLAAPLQVANMLSLGLTRKIGNVFNSRGVAGNSNSAGGFWRVIAPRERGIAAGVDETLEWFGTMTPLPGNGMTVRYSAHSVCDTVYTAAAPHHYTEHLCLPPNDVLFLSVLPIVHAAAGDRYPSSYFNPGATGYELHLYPSVSRRNAVAAHDLVDMAILPRRVAGAAGAALPGARPLRFPEKQGSKDSEDMTLEYPQACLAIYGKWMAEVEISEYRVKYPNQRSPVPAKLAELAIKGERRKKENLEDAEAERAELNKRNFLVRNAIKLGRGLKQAIKTHVLGREADGKSGATRQRVSRSTDNN